MASNLLHAINVALLYVLLLRLVARDRFETARVSPWSTRAAAALATLVFAWHPLAVEPVAAVNFSSDLLATFFTLAALWAATEFRAEHRRSAVALGLLGSVCAMAAVMCKESGLAAVPALIVYWFLFRRDEAKTPWFLFLGAATAATIGYLIPRFLLSLPAPYHLSYLGGSFAQLLGIEPRIWVFLFGKMVYPVGLSADYTLQDLGGITTPLALVILAVMVAAQIWLARKSRLGALGVALFWLGLATVSNFIPIYRPIADRFLYLPMAGVAMQLMAGCLLLPPSRFGSRVVAVLGCLALISLAVLSLQRQRVFVDDFSLWTDTIRASPDSAIAHSGLGEALLNRGEVDDAIVELREAEAIQPDLDQAQNSMGVALLRKGRGDAAILEWQEALKINPLYASAHNNLGNGLAQLGRLDEGIAQCRVAVQEDPYFAKAHYNLGRLLLQKGEVDEAIAEYQQSVQLDPADSGVRNNLGVALLQKGRGDAALPQFQEAVALDPKNADALRNLGTLLLQLGRVDEAMGTLQKAAALKPDDANLAYDLGAIALQKGQVDDAIRQFQAAVKIDPHLVAAHNNLAVALYQKGDPPGAVAEFATVVKLRPGDAKAQANLAKAQELARQAGSPK